jgi:hypothetical protein
MDVLPITPRRFHLTRLMSIWRSAGWPCRGAVELDLVAAGWATIAEGVGGHETIRLTDAGIRLLAAARRRNQRALGAHDQLAERVAANLMAAGRIVWRELSLRARINAEPTPSADAAPISDDSLWLDDATDETSQQNRHQGKPSWRMARPDVFPVRRTSVEDYLQPMVHEVKVSRADLLSDLRHVEKSESYQWLSCETYYVLPAGVAELHEIPEAFGVWLLHGPIDTGTLDLVRPARHMTCKLPFSVWIALAKAIPASPDQGVRQRELGDTAAPEMESSLVHAGPPPNATSG